MKHTVHQLDIFRELKGTQFTSDVFLGMYYSILTIDKPQVNILTLLSQS